MSEELDYVTTSLSRAGLVPYLLSSENWQLLTLACEMSPAQLTIRICATEMSHCFMIPL